MWCSDFYVSKKSILCRFILFIILFFLFVFFNFPLLSMKYRLCTREMGTYFFVQPSKQQLQRSRVRILRIFSLLSSFLRNLKFWGVKLFWIIIISLFQNLCWAEQLESAQAKLKSLNWWFGSNEAVVIRIYFSLKLHFCKLWPDSFCKLWPDCVWALDDPNKTLMKSNCRYTKILYVYWLI